MYGKHLKIQGGWQPACHWLLNNVRVESFVETKLYRILPLSNLSLNMFIHSSAVFLIRNVWILDTGEKWTCNLKPSCVERIHELWTVNLMFQIRNFKFKRTNKTTFFYTTYPIMSYEITSAKKCSKARQTKEKLNGRLKVDTTKKI